MGHRSDRIAFLALYLLVLLVPDVSAGEIIQEMTVPQYLSYEAQAVKWRDLVAWDEKGFLPVFSGVGVLNGAYVILFRFQPSGTERVDLYGRHFSVLFDNKSDLIGMLRVKPEWAEMGRANFKRAAAAMFFIRRFTPELWRYTKSQTLETRDIEVKRPDGRMSVVKGVLSLFYDSKRKTYFFVLIAPDGTVMVFERNLPSYAEDFGWAGENWLYDSCLEKALTKH